MERGTLLKGLRDQRKAVRLALQTMVADKYEATKTKVGDSDKTVLMSEQFTPEETETHGRLVAEWDRITAELRILDDDKDRDRVAKESAELTAKSGKFRDAQAKLNAATYRNLIKVGQDRYEADNVGLQGHPGELVLPAAAIVRDADGVNRVRPFPAVYSRDEGGKIDIEASFRHAEMLRDGKAGQYDPVSGKKQREARFDPLTGERLEAAIETTTTGIPGAIPDFAVDLYRYMITMNEVAMYSRIYQTRGVNDLPIVRRTAVPKAIIAEEGEDYGEQDSTYGTFTLKARKYSLISLYTYESTVSIEPWSVAAQIAMDGGIGLANGFGEHCVIGNPSATIAQPNGIVTAVKATSGMQVSGVAASGFPGNFEVNNFTSFVGSLPIPYFKSPNLRLLSDLGPWTQLLGVHDSEGQAIFLQSQSAMERIRMQILGIPALLDQNMEAVTQNLYPWVVADLMGYAVRYAGGPRIDFSREYKWKSDQLAFRFSQFADGNVVDVNAIRGYKMT